jgi:hypothetical protein
MDWAKWHDAYDDPSSPLRTRLALVQRHLSDALAASPPGPVSLVSLCAGQGHDVLGVLPGHPRRADVSAVLVELDPHNAGLASARAAQAGLTGIDVRLADAGMVASYADALPADVLLLCGIFGNVSDTDIRRTIAAAAGMCVPGGTVIWTRHRRPPDLTPHMRNWFAAAGFEEAAFETPPVRRLVSVGVHRRAVTDQRAATSHAGAAASRPGLPAGRLFGFISPAPPPA